MLSELKGKTVAFSAKNGLRGIAKIVDVKSEFGNIRYVVKDEFGNKATVNRDSVAILN